MPAPPKKNSAYIIYTALIDQSNTKVFKSGPTLAAGDFKVSTDGAAFANLGTLPTNTPSGTLIKISLSAGEMNGDNVSVACIDAAGSEWCDQLINIQTSVRNVDDLAYPATSGRSMVVDAAGLVDSNSVKHGPSGSGTAQTARDIGASVLLSTGTGTGQLDFTSGVVKANLAQILGTALTETAGLLAGGFKKFFNIATPASTMDVIARVTLTDTATNLTNAPSDSSGVTTLLSRLTAIRAGLLDFLDATISSRTKPADTQAAVTLVTTTTNLTNAPGAGDFTSTMKTSLNAATPVATVSGDLSATMKTSVQTAVAAELDAADTELSSIPTVSSGLRAKIKFIWQYFGLQRWATTSTETLYKNDGSTSLGTSTLSNDGTTAKHGKIS